MTEEKQPLHDTHIYKRRWIMLMLYFVPNFFNNFHWIEYSAISNLIMEYYGVSAVAVEWLSMSFMLSYVVLFLPVTYIIEKKGLRFTVITGALLTAIGGWIKVASLNPKLFYVTAIGQSVEAVAEVFLYGMPPYVASTWFGPSEVSTACSLASSSALVGTAAGMLVPAMIVTDSSLDIIGHNLRTIFYLGSVVPTVFAVLVICFFQDKPPKPPSPAQSSVLASKVKRSYKDILKNMMSNKHFVLLLTSYSLLTGVNWAILTLLNEILLPKFPNNLVDIGWLGSISLLVSLGAVYIIGFVMDRTHMFREANITQNFMNLIGLACFTVSVYFENLTAVYASIVFYGLSCAYFAFGFDYGAELAYPEEAHTMANILSAFSLLFSLIIIYVGGWIVETFGSISVGIFFCGLLALSSVVSLATNGELKRLAAQRTCCTDNVPVQPSPLHM